MTPPIGILVMAYGTASGPDDVERYYTDIRGGRSPTPEALAELKGRYAAIGNRFPLLDITRRQAEALERELNAREPGAFRVYLGMKHSAPFISEGVASMRTDEIERAVGLVMAPHYSQLSVGTYIERVKQALADGGGPSFTFVRRWHDHPLFLEVLASRVRETLPEMEPERRAVAVVFTAHSLPERILAEGDPYAMQLRETAETVAERLRLDTVLTAWQSAGRTPEPWLGPDLDHVIREVAQRGFEAVVVCPCGFVADHLEILYDLDIEAAKVAADAGIDFARTESMNDDPAFIRALAAVVRDHLPEAGPP